MSPEMEENEKVAELLANTIREAAKLAADDALAFADVVEKTGDALVERAEGTARELKRHVEEMKERMRSEMSRLSEEIANRSEELAEESSRYIRHCAESRERILEHHRRMNGKLASNVELETEIKNLTAQAMRDSPPPPQPEEERHDTDRGDPRGTPPAPKRESIPPPDNREGGNRGDR
jgi:polyhydroxyalkanoate synthesis regulator phasin